MFAVGCLALRIFSVTVAAVALVVFSAARGEESPPAIAAATPADTGAAIGAPGAAANGLAGDVDAGAAEGAEQAGAAADDAAEATPEGAAVEATSKSAAVEAMPEGAAVGAMPEGAAVEAMPEGAAVGAMPEGAAVEATSEGAAVEGEPLPVEDGAAAGAEPGEDDTTAEAPGSSADAAESAADGAAAAGNGGAAAAEERATARAAEEAAKVAELCEVLVAAADAHEVPHDFFIRLIWKESRFNDNAVSPVGAQGIAQFMPGTARLRGLADPFDRRTALFASASFLADLRAEFGSWGLAAAGYNGGPNRLPNFIAGEGSLPYETVDYVFSITGRPAEFWAARARARIIRGERTGTPSGWIGRGLTAEEVAALSPAERVGATTAIADAEPGAAVGATAAADADEDGAGAGGAPAGRGTGVAMPDAIVATSSGTLTHPGMDAGSGAGAGSAAAATGPGGVTAVAAAIPVSAFAPGAVTADDAGSLANGDEAAATPGDEDPAGSVHAGSGAMLDHPPTLLALARGPFTLPVPRARPDFAPAVDCPTLVARLGRSRSVAPPSVAGGWSPWGAQVAGHVRRDIAMRQYDRLKAQLPRDLVSVGPNVVVRRFAARGRLAIHAVQFAAGSRGEAEALCARVAGSRAPCVVVRNN